MQNTTKGKLNQVRGEKQTSKTIIELLVLYDLKFSNRVS